MAPSPPASTLAPALAHVPGLVDVAPRLLTLGCSLAPAQRLVLLALASHGGPRSKGLYPSIPRLAAETGFCRRTVQTTLHELEQLGVLRIHRRAQASHRYELLLHQLHAAPGSSEVMASATAPSCVERSFTLAEMQAAMAFVAEAGTEVELQLVPELLPSDVQALPTATQSPSTSANPCSATPLRTPPRVPQMPPEAEISTQPQLPTVQRLHPLSTEGKPVVAAPAQPLPPGAQPVPEQGAATAPELGSENFSKNINIPREERCGRAPRPPNEDRPRFRCDSTQSPSSDQVLSIVQAEALWNDAWSARYHSAYTAERGDGARLAFLTRTASDKARARQRTLHARGEPTPGMDDLVRQYLGHLFGAYLAEPGQPTREGPGFLRWKKHPLRFLEGDLARLGDPWAQLDRQQAFTASASSPTQASRPAPSLRVPRLLVPSPAAAIPTEAMVTLGALLGRRPVVQEPTSIRPPYSAEDVRKALGPEATEEEIAAFVRADERRWAYQQRKADDQRKIG